MKHGSWADGLWCRLWTLHETVNPLGCGPRVPAEMYGHVWMGEPLWKPRFPEKFQHLTEEKKRTVWPPRECLNITSPQWQPLSRKTPSEFSCVGRGEPVRKPSFPNWAGCCQRDLFLALTASRLLNRELHDWEEGADWESSV